VHPDRARALWEQRRDELLDYWLADPARLGTRPAAWWRFESTEPRRQLGGRGPLLTERYPNMSAPLDHGMPLFFEIDERDPPRFESEAAFLDRHGLLGAAERRRLDASAFSPEIVVLR
jgi:hypothetical protein